MQNAERMLTIPDLSFGVRQRIRFAGPELLLTVTLAAYAPVRRAGQFAYLRASSRVEDLQ